MEYTIYWLNGKSELAHGANIDEALNTVSKKGKVVYYSEGNTLLDYEFDKEKKSWIPKGTVKYGLEFYPLEVQSEGKDKDGNTIRSFFIDDSGRNKLMVKQNTKLMSLTLKLQGFKSRHIGTVTKSTKTIEMRRERNKHLFININGYGFNHYVLKNQTSVDWIRLSDDTGSHWKIPVKYVLDNGTFYFFKSQGFELQQFLSLENLEQFRVKSEENRRM